MSNVRANIANQKPIRKRVPGAGLTLVKPGARVSSLGVEDEKASHQAKPAGEEEEYLDEENVDGDSSTSTSSAASAANANSAQVQAAAQEEKERALRDAEHYINLPKAGQNDISQAIQACNFKEILRLIKQVPVPDRVDFVNQHDTEGNPLIHQAIFFDSDVKILGLLLDYGANPNLMNNKRNTGLHLASQRNHKTAIEMLINYGADILAENWEHQKPYQMVSTKHEVREIMQNYINTCFEAYEAKLEAKTIIKVSFPMRSYFRSVFDDLDLRERGCLRFEEMESFLEKLRDGGGVEPARPASKEFFKWWNRTNDGLLIFNDFIHGMTIHVAEEEKKKKKAQKKTGKKKSEKGK